MFSKVYDDSKTSYSKRYFKFLQTKDGPCQLATPRYNAREWNFRLTGCKRIEDWPQDALVTLKNDRGAIEDLPWFVGDGTFASSRFCDLAHEIGEDQVQFLPVKIELDGLIDSQVHESYFVVNWLQKIDCLHRELAGFKNHPKYGFRQATNMVLDESLIPEDAIVFRATQWSPALVVREDFLETLSEYGITGWRTMGIEVG